MNNDILWQTKLHARLHDPAEKALVLLRDPAGHEGGNSRVLWRMARHDEQVIEGNIDNDNADVLHAVAFSGGIKPTTYKTVQRADWWAAAADRPQWPLREITVTTHKGEEKTLGVASWAQVRWANQPVLVHPLTGQQVDLGKHGNFSDTDFQDIKARAFSHLSTLLLRNDGVTDFRRSLLAMWRFGPELSEESDNGTLGELWKLLPADTRVPDHSIWDHLDLVSAFAGAFAADPQGEAALLTLSIGPVQSFIASARKMEDLWAGSHLLARLSWEAMRVVAEQFGPDAILFPRLRGVPQVDLWLRDACGLPKELFKDCEWNMGSTDSNPLFAAALPNRFVAVVPASQARELAEAVQTRVRTWLRDLGAEVLQRLLQEAGVADDPGLYCHQQMREQLGGFPEVHWAAVPFSLIGIANREKQTGLDTTQLSAAMRPFFGAAAGQDCGFLATPAWQLLHQELHAQDDSGQTFTFFTPNPGVLYPAVHDLAERALAAAKALRPFTQSRQEGWRDSLSGEAEWLTTDRSQLALAPGQRSDTLWAHIAQSKPAWAKKGEHLGALSAIKRLWPQLFADEVGKALGTKDDRIARFVVSTHTMALAHQLDQWLEHGGQCADGLPALQDKYKNKIDRAALPRRLMRRHQGSNADALKDAAELPALLDLASDENLSEGEANAIRRVVRGTLRSGHVDDRLETYYGLLLMDGDRMGAWLSGGPDYAISYRDSFHPQVQKGFDERTARHADLRRYGAQKRALSPNRHLAISGALNDFSLTVVRHVVEHEHLGRLIYAGGDDVFAMLPVADLLPAMQRLRHAYSGHDPAHEGGRDPSGLTLQGGFAFLNRRLLRMMGTNATASCGAVIAHHQAPLSAVRRELAAAEQRAKNEGGRDAFSITIIKRSGGALRLTAKWGDPVALLTDLRQFLAHEDVSRRAAYHTLQWLDAQTLPTPEGDGAMLQSLLAYQLDRQAGGNARALAAALAQRLVQLTLGQPAKDRITWLRNFISVAEFLAREVRSTPSETA